MTMGLLYIILSLLLNDEAHSGFEVRKAKNVLSWEKALNHCNKTRRNLTFAVPVVNLSSMTVLDKIDLQGDAWVGYFQTYEHFLFIACVALSDIESSVSAKFDIGRLDNRPGMCYSLCGLQGYIGLQVKLCYCVEKGTFSTQNIHSVNSSCEKPLPCVNGMLCGHQGYNNISIYKMVFMLPNDIKGNDTGCFRVTKKHNEYQMSVANCTSKFRHLCEPYTGETLNLEESPTKDQWVDSIRQCATTGKKPTTFIGNRTNFVFPNSSQSCWTSVVRDLVIRNCSESMTIKGTPLYEGFLTKSNEGIKLEFVSAWNNSKKTFVACMSAQPFIEQENCTNAPAGTTITSAPSKAPTMSMMPVLTIILPVGLAALALITVVTLSAVYWRRRKEKATNNMEVSKQKSTETVVPRNSETQQTYDGHETEALNQLEENDQGNVSSEYDSLKEYNEPFSAPTESLYDTANFNIGDGTYAVTFSANTLRQEVQANSYDHVRMKKTNDGKYDHVELQDERNSVNDIGTHDQRNALPFDSTYYETFQETFKLQQQLEENVYNTATFHPTK